MEEAIDGWITTNILLEKFKHRHEKKKRLNSLGGFDTDMVGVLDLGGASTQVTFTCTNNQSISQTNRSYSLSSRYTSTWTRTNSKGIHHKYNPIRDCL